MIIVEQDQNYLVSIMDCYYQFIVHIEEHSGELSTEVANSLYFQKLYCSDLTVTWFKTHLSG